MIIRGRLIIKCCIEKYFWCRNRISRFLLGTPLGVNWYYLFWGCTFRLMIVEVHKGNLASRNRGLRSSVGGHRKTQMGGLELGSEHRWNSEANIREIWMYYSLGDTQGSGRRPEHTGCRHGCKRFGLPKFNNVDFCCNSHPIRENDQ